MQLIKHWPNYLKSIYEHVQPGGYINIAELEATIHFDDDSIPEDSSLALIMRLYAYAQALDKMSLPQHTGPKTKTPIEAAGFTDVERGLLVTVFAVILTSLPQPHLFKQPLAGWPKDPRLKKVSQYLQLSCETGFDAYYLALLTRVLGMSNEEAKDIVHGAIKDLWNKKIHSYIYFYHIVARKPKDA